MLPLQQSGEAKALAIAQHALTEENGYDSNLNRTGEPGDFDVPRVSWSRHILPSGYGLTCEVYVLELDRCQHREGTVLALPLRKTSRYSNIALAGSILVFHRVSVG